MDIGSYILFAFIAGIVAKMIATKERQPNIEIYYENELVVTIYISSISFVKHLTEHYISIFVESKKINDTKTYECFLKYCIQQETIETLVYIPTEFSNSKWTYKLNI